MIVIYAMLAAMACFACYLMGHRDGYDKRVVEKEGERIFHKLNSLREII